MSELNWWVQQGDCLDVLPTLPDNSVDLILTDPPYFKVKGDAWDRQWETPTLFLKWLDRVLEQFARVLRPNGSLYLFVSPKMAARVEVLIGERFEVLSSIVWKKGDINGNGQHSKHHKEGLRTFASQTERIIFAEHRGSDNIAKGEAGYEAKCDQLRGFLFEPLRKYLDDERKAAGLNKIAINVACGFSASPGGMASRHYFSQSQWWLPTPEHYAAMQVLAPQHFRREYEDLRREYEEKRVIFETERQQFDTIRRPFAVTAAVPYTDVWDFPTVSHYPGKHPCEKPQALLRHIVAASSRPGAVVLDAFFGSGAVGEAALALGRSCLGIELSEEWAEKSQQRCAGTVTGSGLSGSLTAGAKPKARRKRKTATISAHELADAAGVPGHDAAAHHADHGLPEHEQPAAGLPAQRAEGEPSAPGAGGAVDAWEQHVAGREAPGIDH